MAALTTTRQSAIWYGSRVRSYHRLGVPNHGFCSGLPRAETVVPHRDPRENLYWAGYTGRS